MLGHGAPWGHAEMWPRAGMRREGEWIDVRVGGQAGLLAGSTTETAEPLEGLAELGGLRLSRTRDKAVLERWLSAARHGARAGDPQHIPLHDSYDLGHHLSTIPLLIPLGKLKASPCSKWGRS